MALHHRIFVGSSAQVNEIIMVAIAVCLSITGLWFTLAILLALTYGLFDGPKATRIWNYATLPELIQTKFYNKLAMGQLWNSILWFCILWFNIDNIVSEYISEYIILHQIIIAY